MDCNCFLHNNMLFRNLDINTEIGKDRSTHYYALEGKAGKFYDWAKKPSNFLAEKTLYGVSLKHIFWGALLALPIAIGNIAGFTVRKINAKKISPEDYQEKCKEWLNEKFFIHNHADGDLEANIKTMKKFIDVCVENKITPDECKHKVILLQDYLDSQVPYLGDEVDGIHYSALKEAKDRHQTSAFVLWSNRNSKSEKTVERQLKIKTVRKLIYAGTVAFRSWYKDYNQFTRYLNETSFCVFESNMPINKKRVSHLRHEMGKVDE